MTTVKLLALLVLIVVVIVCLLFFLHTIAFDSAVVLLVGAIGFFITAKELVV